MAARVRWTGTTAQRGYGAAHQAERTRRLKRYKPGDLCAHCRKPMTYWPLSVARRYLDLPHNADRSGYLHGMAHRKCNRRDGAVRGNRMRGRTARTWRTSRQW